MRRAEPARARGATCAMGRAGRSVALAVAVTVALSVLAGPLLPARLAAAQLSVGHLKSLYIERFTRFIEWPSAVLPTSRPFLVCILGVGETAADLARVAPSRPFKERASEVRRVRPGDNLSACHVLYLSGSETTRLPQILEATAQKPILTVSDSPGFGQRGVLINLFQDGRYLRFEINLPAVKRSGLVFSSQLLRLARQVGEPGTSGAAGPGGGH